jgi:hypothetical protein
MALHPELENNLTKESLNEAVLRGYTKASDRPSRESNEESRIKPIHVKESQNSIDVPDKDGPRPCFVPGIPLDRYYARPITTHNGVTEKDTTLPGIRYLGGKVQLDTYTAPFPVLVFEPDKKYSGDQCGTVITWTDDDHRNYWKEVKSSTSKKSPHPSVDPDVYPSIADTNRSVLGHLLLSPPTPVFLSYSAELERTMLGSDQGVKRDQGPGPVEKSQA